MKEQSSHFSGIPLQPIRDNRAIKEVARERNLSLKGNGGKPLESILRQIPLILNSLQEEHPDFVEKQKTSLNSLIGEVPQNKVEGIFQDGLDIVIKQRYRLFRKESPEKTSLLNDPE